MFCGCGNMPMKSFVICHLLQPVNRAPVSGFCIFPAPHKVYNRMIVFHLVPRAEKTQQCTLVRLSRPKLLFNFLVQDVFITPRSCLIVVSLPITVALGQKRVPVCMLVILVSLEELILERLELPYLFKCCFVLFQRFMSS